MELRQILRPQTVIEMRKLIMLLSLPLFFHAAAQPAFISQGTVTFERRVNMYAVLPMFLKESWKMKDEDIATTMKSIREDTKQFRADDFDLYFDKTASLYKPIIKKEEEEEEEDFYAWFFMRAVCQNTVYSNLASGETVAEKTVYEKKFFIKDSLKHMDWKITEEIREIAGYQCRRANALLADSIYVVAFYADDILVSGGPESFHGLPGMILGVALPHMHVAIFAKSVKPAESSPEKLKMPKPGKKAILVNGKGLMEALFKDPQDRSALQSGWGRKFLKI